MTKFKAEPLRLKKYIGASMVIITDKGTYLWANTRIIAFRSHDGTFIALGQDWALIGACQARTHFLGELMKETKKKVASGAYIVTTLNNCKYY